jgi:hypothetical protein
MEHAPVTPTPLDIQWLQRAVSVALADAQPGAPITLPRSTVELMACVLNLGAVPQQPALASRYQIPAAELRAAVLGEMRRLATEGVAPSKSRWDMQRQRSLPTAQHVCRVLDDRWPNLVQAAGLTLSPYARRFADGVETGEITLVEQDGDGDGRAAATDDDTDEWPVVQTRTEVSVQGNIRITREYHMLR